MTEESNSQDLYGEFMRDLQSKNIEILPDEQVKSRIRTIRSASSTEEEKKAARNEIIDSSLRMIPFVIKKMPARGVAPQELVSEAFFVMNSCINNVDLDFISPITENQVKFSTYVFASLNERLRSPRTVAIVGEALRIPKNAEPFVAAMRRARELFMQEESREPSQSEWYNRTLRFIDETRSPSALLPNPEQFENIKRARFTGVARIGKGAYRGNVNTDTLSPAVGPVEETIADESDTAEEAMRTLLSEDVQRIIKHLSPRDQRVLEFRFGIGLDEEGKQRSSMTHREVAKAFGVSRDRIRQLEERALRKLRHPKLRDRIRDYSDFPKELGNKKALEEQYKEDIQLIADGVLETLSPQNIDDFLEEFKRGSSEDGRLDPELLARILREGDVKGIIQSEENYFRFKPPRSIAKDVVSEINQREKPSKWRPFNKIEFKER